ncbi:large ribosomal subunit protein bL20 [Planococcus citri]|uniref:large ribosomal subunit protein bL20 n=1 Tax=Planococcus citri TaxID=170843 RepID=UPI0031F9A536
MVFHTLVLAGRAFIRNPIPGPDIFWKRRRIFRLTSYLYGRRRNCYRTAIRALHHVLEDCTRGRRVKKQDMAILWETRIDSAAREHGISGLTMREALPRCNIFLDRKTLADLAIWEPRTFKAVTDVAKGRAASDEDLTYPTKDKEDLSHFATKGMLKDPK